MQDPFATLGIEPRFDIDLRSVEQRHRDLSRALHPDRYTNTPAAERRLALNRAIEVNDAWRILRDPIRRAEAMFRRGGVEVGETGEPKPSPDLLMEMLEAREALAEAARKKDLGAVTKLGEAMRQRQDALLASLGRGFADAKGNPGTLKALLPLVGELRYLRRFLDEVSAHEDELTS